MSRNNVIAVARAHTNKNGYKYKYYVIPDLNIEMQFNKEYINSLIKANEKDRKFTIHRGNALCIGHDIQKTLQTEYGVIEIDLF